MKNKTRDREGEEEVGMRTEATYLSDITDTTGLEQPSGLNREVSHQIDTIAKIEATLEDGRSMDTNRRSALWKTLWEQYTPYTVVL